MNFDTLFRLDGQTAVVTGGGGVLGGAMARGLARAGARVAVMSRRADACQKVVDEISAAGGTALVAACDVMDKDALIQAAAEIGPVSILVNAAGGNKPGAISTPAQPFFDLEADALRSVMDLNVMGTVLPSQVFGKGMAARGSGVIINISSLAALRPLTRVAAYAAAKAAIDNFTRWLAITMAQEYSPAIRVNAIAPGFFLGEQNRNLLIDKDTGELTSRGSTIIKHTPMNRFGDPDELVGTLIWLASPAAQFVTGIVVPVDGGFSAFSGV